MRAAGLWGRYIAPDGTMPCRPSIFDIQGAHAPLRPRKTQRETRYWLQMQVGHIRPSKPPTPLLTEAVEILWVVNNYQRLSKPLGMYETLATMPQRLLVPRMRLTNRLTSRYPINAGST